MTPISPLFARYFRIDVRPDRRDNFIEGGMTAFHNAMATRNRFLTTAKALVRALRQAEFERPAADSAPFFFPSPRVADPDPPVRRKGSDVLPFPGHTSGGLLVEIPNLFRCESVQPDDSRLPCQKRRNGRLDLRLVPGIDDRIAGVVSRHASPLVSGQDSRALLKDFIEGAQALLLGVG